MFICFFLPHYSQLTGRRRPHRIRLPPGMRRNPRQQALWIEKQNLSTYSASSKTGGHHAVALFHDSAPSGTKTKEREPHGSRSSFSRASPPSIFAIAPNSGNFCPYTQPCRPKGVFTRMHAGHQPRIRRCVSNVRADRSGRLTAPEFRPPPCKTCKTCKTCRPHKPAQTVRSKTRTHRCRPQKPRASGRTAPASGCPARRRRNAPAATARATPARDRPRGCGRSIRR